MASSQVNDPYQHQINELKSKIYNIPNPGSGTAGKPWMAIAKNISSLPTGLTYGTLNVGSIHGYIGYKLSNEDGGWLVFGYIQLYSVKVSGGTWSYQILTDTYGSKTNFTP